MPATQQWLKPQLDSSEGTEKVGGAATVECSCNSTGDLLINSASTCACRADVLALGAAH